MSGVDAKRLPPRRLTPTQFRDELDRADVFLLPDQHYDDGFRVAAADALNMIADPGVVAEGNAHLLLECVDSGRQAALDAYLTAGAVGEGGPFASWPFPVLELRKFALGAHLLGVHVVGSGWYSRLPSEEPLGEDMDRFPRDGMPPEVRRALFLRPLAPHDHLVEIAKKLRDRGRGGRIQLIVLYGFAHLDGYDESLGQALTGAGFRPLTVFGYFPDLEHHLMRDFGGTLLESHLQIAPGVLRWGTTAGAYSRYLAARYASKR